MSRHRRYAKGRHAVAECQRSGQKMRYADLVEDGHIPGLLVHPDWWEPQHPQELPVEVHDPIALYRPAPEISKPDGEGTPVTVIPSWSVDPLAVTLEANATSSESSTVGVSGGVKPYTYSFAWTSQPDAEIDFILSGNRTVFITASDDASPDDYSGTLRVTVTDHLNVSGTADLTVNVTVESSTSVTVGDFGADGDSSSDTYGVKQHTEISSGSIDPPGYSIDIDENFQVVEISYDISSAVWVIAVDGFGSTANQTLFKSFTVKGAGGASKTLVSDLEVTTMSITAIGGLTFFSFFDVNNGGTTVTWTGIDVGETYGFSVELFEKIERFVTVGAEGERRGYAADELPGIGQIGVISSDDLDGNTILLMEYDHDIDSYVLIVRGIGGSPPAADLFDYLVVQYSDTAFAGLDVNDAVTSTDPAKGGGTDSRIWTWSYPISRSWDAAEVGEFRSITFTGISDGA